MSVIDRSGSTSRRDAGARPWLPVLHPDADPEPGATPPGPRSLRHPLLLDVAVLLPILLLGGLLLLAALPSDPTAGAGSTVGPVLAGAAALWVLARLVPLPRWTAALAVVLLLASPSTVGLAAVFSPTALVTPLALVGCAAAVRRRWWTRALGAVCLAMACAIAPPALLAVPGFLVLLLRPAAGDGPEGPDDVAPGRGLDALLAGAVLVVAVAAVALRGSWPVLDLWDGWRAARPADLAVPAVVVACTGLALLVWRLRPHAVTVAVLLVAVLVTGDATDSPLRLLAPFAALVVAGTVFAVARHRPTRLAGHDVRRSGALAGVLTAGVLAGLVGSGWTADLRALVGDGAPTTRAQAPADPGAGTADPSPPADAGSPSPRGSAGPSPTQEPATPAGGTSPESAAAGGELARNPALELSPAARADLVAGRVDLRLTTLLAVLGATRNLDVESFPVAPDDPAGALRSVRISEVDGREPGSGEPVADRIRQELAGQPEAYRPQVDLARADDGSPSVLVLTLAAAP